MSCSSPLGKTLRAPAREIVVGNGFLQKMVRRIASFILFCLMTVVVATSQPGLSYCLCLEEFFIGGCGHPTLKIAKPASDHLPHGTCPCLLLEGPGNRKTVNCETLISEEPLACPFPCPDCSIDLVTELDAFIVSEPLRVPKQTTQELMGLLGIRETGTSLRTSRKSSYGIRGSPAPDLPFSTISIRLRSLVFLV